MRIAELLKSTAYNTEVVVSLKADKDTPMEEVTKIKQALRESYTFKLNYETNK